VVSGWVVSLCLHEYAHARTALHGGDLTVGAKGYLTLNPFKYANTLLSLVLPVVFVIMGGIGLPGGAVFIERHRIGSRWKHSLISAAGPLVNLVCAVLLLVPIGAGWLDSAPYFRAGAAFLALLQITATVLNLIPVPGFDGYGIIEPWLSPKVRRAVQPIAPFGMLAVFALLWQTPAGVLFWQLAYHVMDLFHVPSWLAVDGYDAFRFWDSNA
jgi:Zn-dependent protease